MKRTLSILLTVLLAIMMFPAISFAADVPDDEAPGAAQAEGAAEPDTAEDRAVTIVPVTIKPPQSQTEISDAAPPLAAPPEPVVIRSPKPPLAVFAVWALMNLVLTILTGLIMFMVLFSYFRKSSDAARNGSEKPGPRSAPRPGIRLALRLLTVAATAVAVILFATTQNPTLPAVLFDQYTTRHLVILAASAALAVLSSVRLGAPAEGSVKIEVVDIRIGKKVS